MITHDFTLVFGVCGRPIDLKPCRHALRAAGCRAMRLDPEVDLALDFRRTDPSLPGAVRAAQRAVAEALPGVPLLSIAVR